MRINLIDAHVHLDHLIADQPESVHMLREEGCLPVSWAFSKRADETSDLKAYLECQARTMHRISRDFMECFYLTGVHPRNIPQDMDPKGIRQMLLPYLDDPLCLGIGEIGLETGSSTEIEVLTSHLEMVGDVVGRGKVFGIHTPRRDKERVTDLLLEVLEDYLPWQDGILVDHCTPGTLGRVLLRGFWAGVTLSPVKCSLEDLEAIVKKRRDQIERVLLNTDSGSTFYGDLIQAAHSNCLEEGIADALFRGNARRFYGIEMGLHGYSRFSLNMS